MELGAKWVLWPGEPGTWTQLRPGLCMLSLRLVPVFSRRLHLFLTADGLPLHGRRYPWSRPVYRCLYSLGLGRNRIPSPREDFWLSWHRAMCPGTASASQEYRQGRLVSLAQGGRVGHRVRELLQTGSHSSVFAFSVRVGLSFNNWENSFHNSLKIF